MYILNQEVVFITAYELFVRSFRDSNGDGIGDIQGIIESLDYLSEIFVDVIWLTPIFPSPSFHGYEVSDYYSVNPLYGDLDSLKALIDEIHKRGMKIILDLPLHHTSAQHRWFKERKNLYKWASESTDINERRPWDGGFVWHPSSGGYYRGLFGPCAPDLNFENDETVSEALKIVKFWKDLGVDGFRFDAAKHIYDDHERNVSFWRRISRVAGKFNVAEVWDPPDVTSMYSEAVGYTFNFHLYGSLVRSLKEGMPDHLFSALSDLESSISENFNFLSSHDTSRIASQIPDERRRLMAFSILMTLPGIPVIYYGDELGVPGVYDPYFPENVMEPFPWHEPMCGEGQTRWKSLRYTMPHRGISYESQVEKDGFFKNVRSWLRFRSENSWIDDSKIEDLRMDGSSITYTLSGENFLSVRHDFGKFQTELR